MRSQVLTAIGPVGNVTIIERPVRPATLVSTFRFALASRSRQYQLRAVMTERDDMVRSLHEADRRKDEFLAMLAHELRNPIASVANAVSLLKSSSEPECHTWAANVIDRQIHQLVHLIDDLLDVSRITTGKIRLRKEIIDAALILDRACESVRPMVKARGHELICRYKHSSMWLEADPTRLEQIMLNLLTNAAKYTPAGGLLQLSAVREGMEIVIQVKDNGMGIAPERLPEMFKLFAQGERSIARSEGGLGIGLTIVQKLAELHDGRVEARSEGANHGSTFIIRLPAAAAPVRPRVPGVSVDAAKAHSLRLLIVDDNVDSAEGLARLLAPEEAMARWARLAADSCEGSRAAVGLPPPVAFPFQPLRATCICAKPRACRSRCLAAPRVEMPRTPPCWACLSDLYAFTHRRSWLLSLACPQWGTRRLLYTLRCRDIPITWMLRWRH